MTFFLIMVDWEETLMTMVFTNPDFSKKGSGAKPFAPYYFLKPLQENVLTFSY
jgi:hypothetical protein